MDPLFKVHRLNAQGLVKANEIAVAFNDLLDRLNTLMPNANRHTSIVRTKLEEACFFAKKGLAEQVENQE